MDRAVNVSASAPLPHATVLGNDDDHAFWVLTTEPVRCSMPRRWKLCGIWLVRPCIATRISDAGAGKILLQDPLDLGNCGRVRKNNVTSRHNLFRFRP
jgi:hypothetical protein